MRLTFMEYLIHLRLAALHVRRCLSRPATSGRLRTCLSAKSARRGEPRFSSPWTPQLKPQCGVGGVYRGLEVRPLFIALDPPTQTPRPKPRIHTPYTTLSGQPIAWPGLFCGQDLNPRPFLILTLNGISCSAPPIAGSAPSTRSRRAQPMNP